MGRFPKLIRVRRAWRLIPVAALLLALASASSAAAAPKKFRVFPGVGIGPVSVGDSKKDLTDRLGKPTKEGRVWAYEVRSKGRSGVVKVLFDGRLAQNVFTVDPAFVYHRVRVGTERRKAVDILANHGFVSGRCGPARAMYRPDELTMFGLYRGEVEHVFVVRDTGACES